MNSHASLPADRDPALWRRAKFQSHLGTFLFVNAVLWSIWGLIDRTARPVPWPLFVTGFWGLGIASQALGVYGALGRGSFAEREYERLLRNR